MRALVIGADGFAGRWLLRHLVDSGDEVIAGVGPRFSAPLPRDLAPLALNVRDEHQVRTVVREAQPEVIYYLAGVSAPDERGDVGHVFEVSVQGAQAALGAAVQQQPMPRVLLVGSSHVYGVRTIEHPVTEEETLRPTSIYGAMKAAAEVWAFGLGAATGLEVIAARPFNHIGPGQQPSFVATSLAAQVATIKASGMAGSVYVGSLDVKRDFTDVRDVVRAYRLLAEQGEPGEPYNIASGKSTSIREILNGLIEIADIEATVVTDEIRARPGEPPEIIGDASKIRETAGWMPEIPLHQTLTDLLTQATTD